MSKPHSFLWQIAATFVILATVGCAHQSDFYQFDPLAPATVGSSDLEPVEVRSVRELLLDAEEAFETANKAQDDGDYETAYIHYTAMLELLNQADIQPSMFYDLRGEFDRLLEDASDEDDIHRRREEERRIIREAYHREPLGDLDIPSPLPQEVRDEINEIQNNYPRNFQRGLNRSARYMPYIKNEFAKAGLPTELAWLAMVESQFWPRAVSPAGASGMWQFMRASGERFDLRQTHYLDERLNWQKSTQAAVEYLTYLYEMFEGEWPLAVSAYNMGEGGMMQAIEMNGGDRDLWRLIETPPASSRIRRETKKFYPRLLATIIVASNPERYGFERNPQDPIPKRRIAVEGSYALAELEQAAGLDEGILKDLNPDLLRDVTPPSGEYRVAVPAEEEERVELALNDLEPRQAPAPDTQLASASGGSSGGATGTGYHEVGRGETLSQIAQHYGVSTQEVLSANNLGNADRLRVGQQLTIPGAGDVTMASGDAGHHEVGRGETLSQIAQQYRVSTQELMAVNNLQNPDQVHIGQELSIPGAGDVAVASASGGGDARTYRVRRGDTLYEIAQREGASIADLQAWNNMGRGDRITVGEVLQVSAPGEGERVHVVESGESPGAIAARYDVAVNDLLEWNGLGRNSVIRPGDELAIRGGSGGGRDSGGGGGLQELVHTVEQGETPSAIAAQYNVSLDDFLEWNDLGRQSTIGIGDELVVRVNHEDMNEETLARVEAEAEGLDNRNGERVIHVVSQGQNPTTIARRYGVALSDLFQWNDWEQGNAPILHVGNEVVVYTE
ncbi:MAG: LysM peptidoglycan-binding domain-containing protein [Candidatus Hydrogenedentota bacterium]